MSAVGHLDRVRNRVFYWRGGLLALISRLLPETIWNLFLRWRGHPVPEGPTFRNIDYQGLRTRHSAEHLHVGRYAETYARWFHLNPYNEPNLTRYRLYNACILAQQCRDVIGDFLCIGVSFGVGPRMIFDYVDLASTEKTLHLVDPFDRSGSKGDRAQRYYYNSDPEAVTKQFPPSSRLAVHRGFAPVVLAEIERPIAFAHLNATDVMSEVASVEWLHSRVSAGGIILCDTYDHDFAQYDRLFAKIGWVSLWFPSGQCAIFKPQRGQDS
jgi:hypothetical protein